VIVPCGIPYIFRSLANSEQDIIPDAALAGKNVRFKVDEVVSIDQENMACETADGTEIGVEKFVLALGSSFFTPKWQVVS